MSTKNQKSPQSLDTATTIAQLREMVAEFVSDRDWQQFHSPKNLRMSLAIEAAELMEHFQWISMEASRSVADDPDRRDAVSDEMADVLCYLLGLANELDIDLTQALHAKMAKNRQKYPADAYYGKFE